MFRTLKVSFLLLPLLAAPMTAQISGSINRGAPTVTSALNWGGAELTVKDTAIHFGEGQWQGVLKNTNAHERFNKRAAGRPIGSIHTNCNVTASGRDIPAGHYDMFFTVHEGAGWVVNFKNKNDESAEALRYRMVMSDTKSNNTRFRATLSPGAESGTAGITFSFGSKTVTVPLKMGAPVKKKMKMKKVDK